MTSEEFAAEVLKFVPESDAGLRELIHERIVGIGRQYEIDSSTQRLEVVELPGLMRDLREEIVDAIVYTTSLMIRGVTEETFLILGHLFRAHRAMEIQTKIVEGRE